MTTSLTSNSASTVELKASYNIPIVLIVGSILLLLIRQPVAGGIIGLFGLFLLYQAVTLSLQFTANDLDLVKGDRLLRRFPYSEWQNWRIFWNVVPILFYFKEINSIHFLPILFDPKTLKACLEERCPRID
jgi:hypothetical protein